MTRQISSDDYDRDLAYFDLMQKWYWLGIFDERIENIISLIPPDIPSDTMVLDVGTGIGTFAVELAKRGFKVTALDYSQTALNICQSLADQTGVEIEPVLGNAEKLPFPAKTFPLIIAADILEHLYQPGCFFQSCWNVLDEGGYLIIETPNAKYASWPFYRHLKFAINQLFRLQESVNLAPLNSSFLSYHVSFYSPSRLKNDLEQHGFRPLKVALDGWWLELKGFDLVVSHLARAPLLRNVLGEVIDTDILTLAQKTKKTFS